MLHEDNSLHLIQTLQGEGPAASPCSWQWVPIAPRHLLKMKKQCPVLRVGGKHRQEAAPRVGDTARHTGAQPRGPHLPGSTDTAGSSIVTPA